MNCKPGDLAVVKVPRGFKLTLQDKFVSVIGCHSGFDDICQRSYESPRSDVWLVRFSTAFLFHHNGRSWMVRQAFLLDSWLRPIRNPGDDARDETLEWKRVPSREGQPA
jgi:hypothetical protein